MNSWFRPYMRGCTRSWLLSCLRAARKRMAGGHFTSHLIKALAASESRKWRINWPKTSSSIKWMMAPRLASICSSLPFFASCSYSSLPPQSLSSKKTCLQRPDWLPRASTRRKLRLRKNKAVAVKSGDNQSSWYSTERLAKLAEIRFRQVWVDLVWCKQQINVK